MNEPSTTDHLLAPLRRHVANLEDELQRLDSGQAVQLFNGTTREERRAKVALYIVAARGHLSRMIATYRERYGAR